jgi:DNA-binding NtrC family response regulator
MENRARVRILVVDEDAWWRVFLSELLEAHGYAVVTKQDIRAGLNQARGGHFDLIIINNTAFNDDYINTLQDLVRNQDGYRVVIASPPDWRMIRQIFRLGAFDNLPKMPDRDEVLRTVERAVASRRSK